MNEISHCHFFLILSLNQHFLFRTCENFFYLIYLASLFFHLSTFKVFRWLSCFVSFLFQLFWFCNQSFVLLKNSLMIFFFRKKRNVLLWQFLLIELFATFRFLWIAKSFWLFAKLINVLLIFSRDSFTFFFIVAEMLSHSILKNWTTKSNIDLTIFFMLFSRMFLTNIEIVLIKFRNTCVLVSRILVLSQRKCFKSLNLFCEFQCYTSWFNLISNNWVFKFNFTKRISSLALTKFLHTRVMFATRLKSFFSFTCVSRKIAMSNVTIVFIMNINIAISRNAIKFAFFFYF